MANISGPGEVKQVGTYLKILSDRYRMIERRPPILALSRARSGRYYVRDNFLRAWLSALQRPRIVLGRMPPDPDAWVLLGKVAVSRREPKTRGMI